MANHKYISPSTTSLSNHEKVLELEEELKHVKSVIVGLSEIRWRGEQKITPKSGNTVYFKGNEEDSTGGVWFVIHKKHVSSRVCFLK